MIDEAANCMISVGWKDVNLKIYGSEEAITIPVMMASKVIEVKRVLADMLGLGEDAPHKIDFIFKSGCSYKKHRNGDSIQTNIIVKGIESFAKPIQQYPHPFGIIGGGIMGVRQALQFVKSGHQNFGLLEKRHKLGGSAWLETANSNTRLQSEGPHYQLQYDVLDEDDSLLPLEDFPYWPTRGEILRHVEDTVEKYTLQPHLFLGTEVVDMKITDEQRGAHFAFKQYDMELRTVPGSGDRADHVGSCCYKVVHERVAIRNAPSTDAAFVGAVSDGQEVRGVPYDVEGVSWLRIEKSTHAELGVIQAGMAWVLMDGESIGLGFLMIPLGDEPEHLTYSEGGLRAEDTKTAPLACICFFPGCLCVPRRKDWPGEEVFGGQIGYGFSDEFDFARVAGENGIIIGMGAFALESVQDFCEAGGNKVSIIARHHNLVLPRLVSWWMNQSANPPTAAMCLDAMKPMYGLVNWDPWEFSAVNVHVVRKDSSISQRSRWGVSDVFFLAVYAGRAEVIKGEVKRFKYREVALINGNLIKDIDHVIKVMGFDGGFEVDKLMQTTVHIGPWPDGDWRRFVLCDQPSIDASRFGSFGSTALAPALSTACFMTQWYFQHPRDAWQILGGEMLPHHRSQPELGVPAYCLEARHVTVMLSVLCSVREVADFEAKSGEFKKRSMESLAPPGKYLEALKEDWGRYCQALRAHGCDAPAPRYPYAARSAEELLAKEGDLKRQDERARGMPSNINIPHSALSFEPAKKRISKAATEAGPPPPVLPHSDLSFEPARAAIIARARSKSPSKSKAEAQPWLREGHEVKNFLLRRTAFQNALGDR